MTLRVSIACALITGPFAAPATAPAQTVPETPIPVPANRPLHSLPFDLSDGRIFIEARVAGSAPRSFLLDTGAQITHLTQEAADLLGLKPAGALDVAGLGPDLVQARYLQPVELDLGGFALPTSRAIAAPAERLFGAVTSASARGIDGIIGYDLFAAYVVEIDYERRLISLYDPAEFHVTDDAIAVPIRLLDNKPYVEASFALGGSAPMSASLLLDTGFGGALGFNAEFTQDHGLIVAAGRTLASSVRGVGGVTPARLGRVDSLAIGAALLPDMLATFSLELSPRARAEAAGRVGGAILRRFTVTLDYGGGRLLLKPNSAFGRPLETDMSGLSLVAEAGAIKVRSVEPGSAADEAGVMAGDALLAIDDAQAAGTTLDSLRARLMQDGALRYLLLSRQGREIRLPLKLRRRI